MVVMVSNVFQFPRPCLVVVCNAGTPKKWSFLDAGVSGENEMRGHEAGNIGQWTDDTSPNLVLIGKIK